MKPLQLILCGGTGILAGALTPLLAGPYSAELNDPSNAFDAPVPGFTGPHGIGKARLDTFTVDDNGEPIYTNPGNYVNPLFFAWAETVVDYTPSESVTASFSDPVYALGPVTGDNFDVVSLGDLNTTALTSGDPPGTITLELPKPVRNLTGADFVVFENGHITQSNQGGAGVGKIFGELAYVEVSNDGVQFHRFPCHSLTAAAAGMYGSIDATGVRNLAGKHVNAYGDSWGTPFDLSEVGLTEITHVRIVDIPGNGSFYDAHGNPVYDAWKTFGSGGFDLEAVGAISTSMTFAEWPQLANLAPEDRGADADPDQDGTPNLLEYAFAALPWKADTSSPTVALTEGRVAITFIRDERLADLFCEVQASSTMAPGDWETIATSTAGAALQGANGHVPVISETSAQTIQGIGVIRKTTVRDIVPLTSATRRFLRVKVTKVPLP